MFTGKTLMITGGTGSFGKTILSRFLDTDIGEIVIFSRDEKKQEDLRLLIGSKKVRFILGDIRDAASITRSMKGIDYVFHAAALKQVPSCEFYPMEAVQTNVVGTDNVISAAVEAGVARLILLSTDKAVYPINAMGISKSMAEKILVARSRQARNAEATLLCATRYGNVMASRGSVIPLFVERIKANRPLTLTNPSMTRFLMSLEESVDLVLHAFSHGRQGDIFVQKAPACTVANLAAALKEVFRSDVPVSVMGSRHGEKLHETLVSREELAKAESIDRYYRIPADTRDLNYNEYTDHGSPAADELLDYTSGNTRQLTVPEIIETLLGLDYIRSALSSANLGA